MHNDAGETRIQRVVWSMTTVEIKLERQLAPNLVGLCLERLL